MQRRARRGACAVPRGKRAARIPVARDDPVDRRWRSFRRSRPARRGGRVLQPGRDEARDGDRGNIAFALEHIDKEEKVGRLTRVHAVLSGINAAIVRIRDRQELFHEACRIAIDHGKFRMAWIGLVDREAGLVKPVASAGDVRDFFESAPLAVTEAKPGNHGLAGRAIRDMKPVISNNVENDPQKLMRKELDERAINSLAIIPLIVDGEAIGVLALYAAETGAFDDEEMRLLLELAGDISFALEHIDKAEKLDYLAYYDELTGIANRSLL